MEKLPGSLLDTSSSTSIKDLDSSSYLFVVSNVIELSGDLLIRSKVNRHGTLHNSIGYNQRSRRDGADFQEEEGLIGCVGVRN